MLEARVAIPLERLLSIERYEFNAGDSNYRI